VRLSLIETIVDRLSTFKLQGMYISNVVKWIEHTDTISSVIPVQFETCRNTSGHLQYVSRPYRLYCTVIRPIDEYVSPVWHSNLAVASTVLESLQKLVMNVTVILAG